VSVSRQSQPSGRARRRESASLCLRWPGLLRRIILLSLDSRLGPLVTAQTFELSEQPQELLAGRAELDDGERFFGEFSGALAPEQLAGKRVLDVGCGFGGRTIYYARHCGAAEVVGIEPMPEVIERCDALARELGCENVAFEVGVAERLPFADASFDAVVSFDVLEHVDDPFEAIEEIRRVLRPEGTAWLVFPTYRGMRASHLDYMTRVPALHRIFDPDTIIETVNSILADHGDRIGVPPQPRPRVSAIGHLTLPNLNGLTLPEARAGVARAGLALRGEWLRPFVRPTDPLPGAAPLAHLLAAWQRRRELPELMIGSIALELTPLSDGARR